MLQLLRHISTSRKREIHSLTPIPETTAPSTPALVQALTIILTSRSPLQLLETHMYTHGYKMAHTEAAQMVSGITVQNQYGIGKTQPRIVRQASLPIMAPPTLTTKS